MKAIVSLNSGSSSIKFALFTLDGANNPTLSTGGKIERICIAPCLRVRSAEGDIVLERDWAGGASLSYAEPLKDIFAWTAERLGDRQMIAIGHRVVHGGTEFAAPHLVDDAVLEALEKLNPLAPLHQPHNLGVIRAIAQLRPELPQVARFDTASHHDKPAVATRLPLPRAFHEQGIRQYGFHGLSYECIARRLREIDPVLAAGRVIAAHLGNGASLCAMQDGKSIDSTMGFTALDGLMMGGAIDPGIVLHLQTQLGMSAADVEDLLYRKSGLLGVSGISSDMRTLSDSSSPEAEEAIELFCWRVAREAGGLIASLGGLDAFVFTAGIGENHADVRRRICERLAWSGLRIDEASNRSSALRISVPDSPVAVLVIPTDEERMIALHALQVLGENPS